MSRILAERGRQNCSEFCVVPETSRPTPTCMVTEYQEKFVKHDISTSRRPRTTQNQYHPPEGKMALTTTFRSDYTPPGVTQKPPRVTQVYVPPEGAFSFITSYAHDYKAPTLRHHGVSNSVGHRHPPACECVQPLYADDFRLWDDQRPSSSQASITCQTDAKSDMSTSRGQCCSQSQTLKERRTLTEQTQEHTPFDGLTNYKLHYVSHPVQPRQPKQAKHQGYIKCTEPFSAVSTQRHDYRGLTGARATACRPFTSWQRNSAPFQGSTEVQDSYRAWPVVPMAMPNTVGRCPLQAHMKLLCPVHGKHRGHQVQASLPTCPVHFWAGDKVHSKVKEDHRCGGTKREEMERSVTTKGSTSAYAELSARPHTTDTDASRTPGSVHVWSCSAAVLLGSMHKSPVTRDQRLYHTLSVTERTALTPAVASDKTACGCWGKLCPAKPTNHGSGRAQ